MSHDRQDLRRAGFALPATLLAMFVIGAILTGGFYVSAQEHDISVSTDLGSRALLAAEYGIEHDLDGMTGVTEHRPAVFLIDGDRTVQYAWVAETWPDFPNYDDVDAAIDDL